MLWRVSGYVVNFRFVLCLFSRIVWLSIISILIFCWVCFGV